MVLSAGREHGRDGLVVERLATLVEIAAGFELGRYGAQGQLSALGLFASQRLGKGDDVGALLRSGRFCQRPASMDATDFGLNSLPRSLR